MTSKTKASTHAPIKKSNGNRLKQTIKVKPTIKSAFTVVPFINSKNITDYYPHFKEIIQRVVKVTVYNNDGTKMEMRFTYPPFCFNGDCSGAAVHALDEWVKQMSSYHLLDINHYTLESGSIDKDGKEEYGASYGTHKVENGKRYVTIKHAETKWMTRKEYLEFKGFQDYDN